MNRVSRGIGLGLAGSGVGIVVVSAFLSVEYNTVRQMTFGAFFLVVGVGIILASLVRDD